MAQPNDRLAEAIGNTIAAMTLELAHKEKFQELAADLAQTLATAEASVLRDTREFLVHDATTIAAMRKTLDARVEFQDRAIAAIDAKLAELEAKRP